MQGSAHVRTARQCNQGQARSKLRADLRYKAARDGPRGQAARVPGLRVEPDVVLEGQRREDGVQDAEGVLEEDDVHPIPPVQALQLVQHVLVEAGLSKLRHEHFDLGHDPEHTNPMWIHLASASQATLLPLSCASATTFRDANLPRSELTRVALRLGCLEHDVRSRLSSIPTSTHHGLNGI